RWSDVCGPIASIGVDTAQFCKVIGANIGRRRGDDYFEGLIGDHHARHAGGKAIDLWIGAQGSGLERLQGGFKDDLIFGNERSLLLQATGLAGIPLRAHISTYTLSIPIPIFLLYLRLCASRLHI